MLKYFITIAALLALGIAVAPPLWAAGTDALKPAPRIHAPTYGSVRGEVLAWAEERGMSERAASELERLWPPKPSEPPNPGEVLDRLWTTLAIGDQRACELLITCLAPRTGTHLPDVAWLTTAEVPPLMRNHLKLLYGRWLAQQRLYDESLDQLRELIPADVVDPATLTFYQAVGHHRLLHKSEGLAALDRLLDDTAEVPVRYRTVGSLMRSDLSALDDKSLDHITRRMDDVRRRLELGRAGKHVREIEDGVIASLDKLIEDMEKKAQQQSMAGASSGGSATPMQQPRLAPAQGAGEVDHKRIGNSSGWGDLPPKQREEALQQIGKDFPAHYRDVIEQYFRKLASEAPPR
ncbi:MAG TPA: hypothetical protein VHZ24_00880 [Pirellulales bacterium]|jgi:hypothetical protein|nr:hypothetical protein [Pirellulales bacterium]